jgi:microsomal dipeptidase-like Zn-dependent dipeptidase
MTTAPAAPIIDVCQYCNWSPEMFGQLREGGVDAVSVTVSYHEDFSETVERLIDWNRRFKTHRDLMMKARLAADIDAARWTAKTAVLFASQNPSCSEDDIGLGMPDITWHAAQWARWWTACWRGAEGPAGSPAAISVAWQVPLRCGRPGGGRASRRRPHGART